MKQSEEQAALLALLLGKQVRWPHVAEIVLEAGEYSGARIQARMALKHGRQVILPREMLRNQWVRDYERRPGAHLVNDIEELMSAVHSVLADAEVKADELVGEAELVW